MRSALFPLLLAGAGLASPVALAQSSSPLTVVKEVYQTELAALSSAFDDDSDDVADSPPMATDAAVRDRFFSKNLVTLLAADDRRAEQDGMGCLDFDPIFNAQDFDVSDLKIAVEGDDPPSKVTVRFRNADSQEHLLYTLAQENGAWKITDIWDIAGEDGWSLTDLLDCNE